MGTTQSAVSRMESGRTLPTLELLERSAVATERPFEVVFGAESKLPDRAERRRRLRRAFGRVEFNPWDRDLTRVEAQYLEADGLIRERFEGDPSGDVYLDRVRQAAVTEDEVDSHFDSALAWGISRFEVIDWSYVDHRVDELTEEDRLVGEAMSRVDARVRRRARETLTEP